MGKAMTIGILVVGAAALAVAAPHVAKRAYHGAQQVVTKTATVATRATGGESMAGVKPIDPSVIPPTIVGMNVGVLSYYSSEEPYYDPLKAHADITLDNGSAVKDMGQLKRTPDGWFLGVPKDTVLQFAAGSGSTGMWPADCTMSSGWRVDFVLGGSSAGMGNKFRVTVPKDSHDGVIIKVRPEKDGANLTGFTCIPVAAPAGALFRPDFLAEMKPFRIIRFMNWMLANGSPSGKWADRPVPSQPTAVGRGVSVEHMVMLANQLHSDPWFTMPFDADEDYLRRFATYVRDNLDPGLKAYVELSNEVWNNSFAQSKKASQLGAEKYPKADGVQQNDYYYADRVRETMAVWSDVFKGQNQRIVRVLADMNGWDARAGYALGHEKTWASVDAVAVAPYFGDVPFDVPGAGKQRVDGILAKMPAHIEAAIGGAKNIKKVANKYGLRLIAYEGGPGMNAYEKTMVDDVVATYHDPRFVGVYRSFLERWKTEIGGELVLFDYSGDGIWSHLDHTGQPLDKAPKMKAVREFIDSLPPSQK